MDDVTALREQVAAMLIQHAETTGDCRFKLAAGLLRGKKPGRPRKGAAGTSHEIAALLNARAAASVEDAARMVAAAAPRRVKPAAIVARYIADAPRLAA